MPIRIGNCELHFNAVARKGIVRDQALRSILNVNMLGAREASGKAVLVDPSKARVKLFFDEGMLGYDFSKYTIVNLPKEGFAFKPAQGKTLKGILKTNKGNILFACNGQTDNMWCSNSVIVVDGKIIQRTAPGIGTQKVEPLEGNFPFFIFDFHRVGIEHITFRQGEPQEVISFENGLYGPLLIYNHQRMDHLIERAFSNIRPNELLWDPTTNQAAMTAVGHNVRGEIIFISLAGDPDKQNECLLKDVVDVFWKLKAVNAILLGVSGDVQQYVSLSIQEEAWLIARARAGSTMAKMFPEGRPLSSAIVVEEI